MRPKQSTVWKNERKFSAEFLLSPHPFLYRTLFNFKSAEAKRIIKIGL
jgi:hypothetical protein